MNRRDKIYKAKRFKRLVTELHQIKPLVADALGKELIDIMPQFDTAIYDLEDGIKAIEKEIAFVCTNCGQLVLGMVCTGCQRRFK